MKLKIYGCRGSAPVTRDPPSRYGGNTSCILLEAAGQALILDAGSGLARLEIEWRAVCPSYPHNLPYAPRILLSHLHLDHIIGLSTFAPMWVKHGGARIYTRSRDDRPLKAQVLSAFAPPYWPAPMDRISPAEIIPVELDKPFTIGPLAVTAFEASHPDMTTAFHITDGEKKLVYLLDNEIPAMDEKEYASLIRYCRNADMIIFDAAYTPGDYPGKRTWGHSTAEDGVRLAAVSGCKRLLFSHYGHEYDDDTLDAERMKLDQRETRFLFARDGMEIDV